MFKNCSGTVLHRVPRFYCNVNRLGGSAVGLRAMQDWDQFLAVPGQRRTWRTWRMCIHGVHLQNVQNTVACCSMLHAQKFAPVHGVSNENEAFNSQAEASIKGAWHAARRMKTCIATCHEWPSGSTGISAFARPFATFAPRRPSCGPSVKQRR